MILFILLCCGDDDSYSVEIGPKNKTETELDTGTESAFYELESCAELPYVTWDNWAKGMLTTHCQGCHASESPTTYGVPAGVHFDTHAEALAWKEQIRARVFVSQDMPPAGGLLEDEFYLLQIWLDCWSEE
jgi:uncharacterized membrane protein